MPDLNKLAYYPQLTYVSKAHAQELGEHASGISEAICLDEGGEPQ